MTDMAEVIWLRAEVERLRAAVEESREAVKRSIDRLCAASQWQPIETAPKDGTHILALPVLLDVACVVSWKGDGIAGFWRLPMTDKVSPYHPRYWQPLPSPPTQEGGK